MSIVEELPGAPERPTLIGRLLGAADDAPRRSRSAPGALVAGGLALGAFVASLISEWQVTTVDMSNFQASQGQTLSLQVTIGSIETLGLVYILGGIALLGFVGAAISRPQLAAGVRLPLVGVTGGLLAVMAALTIQLPKAETAAQFGLASLPVEFQDGISSTIQPGLYFAYAAIVLPAVAVFFAGSPLTRTQGSAREVVEKPAPHEVPPALSIRAEGATGLTVSAADLPGRSAGTDVWRTG